MWKKEDTSPAEERLFGQQTHTDLSKAERSGLDVYQLTSGEVNLLHPCPTQPLISRTLAL